jgi:hypothetical protein
MLVGCLLGVTGRCDSSGPFWRASLVCKCYQQLSLWMAFGPRFTNMAAGGPRCRLIFAFAIVLLEDSEMMWEYVSPVKSERHVFELQCRCTLQEFVFFAALSIVKQDTRWSKLLTTMTSSITNISRSSARLAKSHKVQPTSLLVIS